MPVIPDLGGGGRRISEIQDRPGPLSEFVADLVARKAEGGKKGRERDSGE